MADPRLPRWPLWLPPETVWPRVCVTAACGGWLSLMVMLDRAVVVVVMDWGKWEGGRCCGYTGMVL